MEIFEALVTRIENALQTLPFVLFLNGQCIENTSPLLLNTTENALHITIPKNKHIPQTCYLIHLFDNPILETHTPISQRLYALENSNMTIVEAYYLHDHTTPLLINTLTEIYISKQAFLRHHVQSQSKAMDKLNNTLIVNQEQNSQYIGTFLQTSMGEHDTNITLNLWGPSAIAEIHALTLSSKTQNKTLQVLAHHHSSDCASRTTARGIVNDQGKSHLMGTIHVNPKATHTDARLDTKQLLLSEQAEAKVKPELEIYNDDVQCTHGATVGYLDIDALFYLKSRGIPEADAKKLLIAAFMEPILKHIPSNTLTDLNQEAHGY